MVLCTSNKPRISCIKVQNLFIYLITKCLGPTILLRATFTPRTYVFSLFFSKIFLESFQYINFYKKIQSFLNTIMLRFIFFKCQNYVILKNQIVFCVLLFNYHLNALVT
jgi:hypothetical protein